MCDDDAELVDVPTTINPLHPSDYGELERAINPTAYSENHGRDQYIATVQFVHNKVSNY